MFVLFPPKELDKGYLFRLEQTITHIVSTQHHYKNGCSSPSRATTYLFGKPGYPEVLHTAIDCMS